MTKLRIVDVQLALLSGSSLAVLTAHSGSPTATSARSSFLQGPVLALSACSVDPPAGFKRSGFVTASRAPTVRTHPIAAAAARRENRTYEYPQKSYRADGHCKKFLQYGNAGGFRHDPGEQLGAAVAVSPEAPEGPGLEISLPLSLASAPVAAGATAVLP